MGGVGSKGNIGNKGGARAKLFVCFRGEKCTVKEASKQFGVTPRTLRRRLQKGFQDLELVKPRGYKYNFNKLKKGIKAYQLIMKDFYTKSHRLECYKQLIKEMKEQRMKIAA